MNWHDMAPWIAPLTTGFVLFLFGRALPGLIVTAIDGKFSDFRNEEVSRMATHNENEFAHPRLHVLSEFEKRMEKAFEELREGQRTLSEQLDELKNQLRDRIPAPKIEKKRR